MALAEFGDQRNKNIVPFHKNFHRGINPIEADETWLRLTEASPGIPEVQTIESSAEIVALDALSVLSGQAAAA